MTQNNQKTIDEIIKRYNKKLGYNITIYELFQMYTDGTIILLTDNEENTISQLIYK